MKRRLVLTGASGLLGRALGPRLAETFELLPLAWSHAGMIPGARALDLTDAQATRAALDALAPEIIVHAAALADVDACENNPGLARRINSEATRTLADWASEQAAAPYLVYISTDQVYDGPGPHGESEAKPGNVYARTKLLGEECAARAPRAVVLRTNFFVRGGGLAGWLEQALAGGEPVSLFDDVFFNPLFAGDLADILCRLIDAGPTGVVNVGASGAGCSKGDFARGLAARLGLPLDKARSGRIADLELAAWRPSDMRMDITRLVEILGTEPPSLEAGLDRMCAAGQEAETA